MIKNKSFTLIELLVVIVIIGILAGVIMISTSSSIDKANFAKAKAFSSTAQNELLSNLVSEWTFDEPEEGNITKDTWGNNHGIVVGATQVDDCVFGKCYSFNGANDYIDIGQTLKPSRTKDKTYSFWVNLNSYGGTVFASGNLYSYKGGFSVFKLKNNTSISFSYELNDSPYQFDFKCSTNLKTWTFFVITFKPNNLNIAFNLYKNGTLVDNQTKTLAIGGQNTTSSKIGAQSNGNPIQQIYFLNGFIDDFRVYDAALSSSQIKQNYIAGLNSMLANGNISKEDYNERINTLAYEQE